MQIKRYDKHGYEFAEVDTPAGKCVMGPVSGIPDSKILEAAGKWAEAQKAATAAMQERARGGAVLLPHGNDPV